MINKIISAGLTGVERAALDVAIKVDIPHGGWTPKGRRTEGSVNPEKYRLREMSGSSDLDHIEKNILDSDGTLIISQGQLTGEKALTEKMAEKLSRPCLHVELNISNDFVTAQAISAWIAENRIETLNVAGQGLNNDPRLYNTTAKIFETVLYFDMMGFSLVSADQISKKVFKTVDDVANETIFRLPLKDKATMANMNQEDLASLHPSLGEFIKNNFGLRGRNKELLESCRSIAGKMDIQDDDAVLVILNEVWMRLSKSHRIRVVK